MSWSPSGDPNSLGERRWLQPNEQILWEGEPDPKVIFAKQDRILVPFSLVWAGFALFWETGVSMAGFFPGSIFGLVFVAVGMYMVVGRFFYKRWDRRRIQYVVTNRRALVLRSGGRSFQEAPIVFAPMQVEIARDERHGSVIWSLDALSGRQTGGFGRVGNKGTMSSIWLIGTGWPGSGSNRIPVVAFLDVTNFEGLDDFPRALLSSVLELLAERKVNHPGAALTVSPDDLVSSWDLVAASDVLPDPPGQPDAGEELASAFWYEQALGDLIGGGFLSELEDNTYRVSDLENLLQFRDSY